MDIGANSVGTSGQEELPSAGVCVCSLTLCLLMNHSVLEGSVG